MKGMPLSRFPATLRRPDVPPEKRRPWARGPAIGVNHQPLEEWEAKRWAKLEADAQLQEIRDRMHDARMIDGLGLCGVCWGFVDDPRHVRVLGQYYSPE